MAKLLKVLMNELKFKGEKRRHTQTVVLKMSGKAKNIIGLTRKNTKLLYKNCAIRKYPLIFNFNFLSLTYKNTK